MVEKTHDVTEEQVKYPKQDVIAAWRVKGIVDIAGDRRQVSVIVLEDRQHNKYYMFDAREKIASAVTPVERGAEEAKSISAYDISMSQNRDNVNDTLYQLVEPKSLPVIEIFSEIKIRTSFN